MATGHFYTITAGKQSDKTTSTQDPLDRRLQGQEITVELHLRTNI